MTARRLEVSSDGLALDAAIEVPEERTRGVAVLLHGIPSIAPPDPDDPGYPGLARTFAAHGWAAAWGDMRSVRGSPGYFSIEGWVNDAAAIVAAARSVVADGPAVLVGSSAGGAVATEAVRRGLPVDALVLLAAPAAWLSFAADPAAGVVRVTADAGMQLAPETIEDPTQWAAEFERVTTELAIEEVKVPVLVVHGTADDVVPVDHAARIASAAAGSRLEIVEGASHQLRRDERVVGLVLDWLDELFPIAP